MPTNDQVLALLDGLQKGDHLALRWDPPAGTPADRCVTIYLRVSSKRQLEGEGLGDQWRACLAYATREHLTIVGLYVDPAISGRKERRPAIDQLKRDAVGRRFRTVLFFKVNRVGRNARASYETAEEIERHGLAVVSATEPFRRGTAAGNLTFGMLVTVAQFGSDQLSEVMKTRLAHKAQQGRWVGPTPLGTRVEDGVLTAAEGLPIVEALWRRYAGGGESFMSAADWLNAQGHRTAGGQPFSRESVRTLLKSRAYCGYVSAGGVEYPGLHGELFLDARDLWARTQAIMGERQGGAGSSCATVTPLAWLTGRLWCEHCREHHEGVSCKLWHRTNTGRDGVKRRYFRCAGFDSRIHPDADMVPAATLEAQGIELLAALTIPTEHLPAVLERAHALVAERAGPPRLTLNPEQLQQQIERLGEAYTDGALSRERYQKRLAELRAQQAEAAETGPTLTLDERAALALLRDVPALVASARPEHLRQLVTAAFSRLWVEGSAIVAVTPRAEIYPLLVARSITMGWSVQPTSPEWSVGRVPDGPQMPSLHYHTPRVRLRAA
jgi:DNA invertase Pin-like site-specific DNA recombinase